MRYISFCLFCVILSPLVLARPISYPGGWTLMQQNNWDKSRVHVHYSPRATDSIGLVLERTQSDERVNAALQWNHLLGRRNTKKSQANLYLKTQAGMASQGDTHAPYGVVGVAGDWETRRYFVSYEAEGSYADTLDDGSFHHTARVGIAPYVADYGKLHTWVMLQAEHHPEAADEDAQLVLTPLIRMFKGPYLGELGLNSNGDALFNWIVRF